MSTTAQPDPRKLRIVLLSALLQELEQGRISLARADARAILENSALAQRLCDQVLSSTPQGPGRAREGPASGEEIEVTDLVAGLYHLVRVHTALLRRVRRTIAIVAHLLPSNDSTYGPQNLFTGRGNR